MPLRVCTGSEPYHDIHFDLRPILLLISCFLASSVQAYTADLELGRRAYERKKYVNAMKELAPPFCCSRTRVPALCPASKAVVAGPVRHLVEQLGNESVSRSRSVAQLAND